MLKRLIKYIYHYGVVDFIQRLFDPHHVPRGVGFLWMFRFGVYQVGSPWTIPTRKSIRIWNMLRRTRGVDVILTLSWGGGTASYLMGRIADKQDGTWTVVVQPNCRVGLLWADIWNGGKHIEGVAVRSLKALYPLRKNCQCLVVNHLIQWHYFLHEGPYDEEDYRQIVEGVLRLKSALRSPAIFMVHDYFSVCPRYALTTKDNEYCNSEYSCEKCAACLSTNENAGLAFVPGQSITKWRVLFGRLLGACEEVRTFSEDTLARMRRIYPDVQLTLVPHKSLAPFGHIPTLQKQRLVIGVIGGISQIKGSRQVVDLAKHLDDVGDKATRIVIIGHLDVPKSALSQRISVTGDYKREDLPLLIEKNGINVALFASVCPETFSYVTQELIQMHVPVVCYNIGAPKDRVLRYEHGQVIPEITTASTWRTIQELASKERISI